MIPAAFSYARADSVDEAIALLAEHGDDAKLLAGGHSLLPLMKLRLATPSVLVDVGRLDDLSFVRDDGDTLAIGGLTRHHDVEHDTVLREHAPLLAAAAGAGEHHPLALGGPHDRAGAALGAVDLAAVAAGQLGGQPYGCLIGDYAFSHVPTDVQLLRDISKIAAAAHAPFFAAADSTLMGMDSWNELMNPRDLSKLFDTPE